MLPGKKGNDRRPFGTNGRVNGDVRCLVPPLGAGTHLPGRSLPILGEAHLAGFRDDHINEEIVEASRETSQLGLFFVVPRGRSVLHRQAANQIRVPQSIDDVPCVGESRRDFRATFSGDEVEIRAFNFFFDRAHRANFCPHRVASICRPAEILEAP